MQAGAPGEPSRSLSEQEASRLGKTPHTKADVDFMLGMIHHHAQALVMTRLVRKRSASEEIPLLARRTEISQASEIDAGLAAARRAGPSPAVRERAERLSSAGGSPALCYVG